MRHETALRSESRLPARRDRGGLRPLPGPGDLPDRVHRHAEFRRRPGCPCRTGERPRHRQPPDVARRSRSSPTSTMCSFATGCGPSESLASGDFTVEMETGTGKTYVYLRIDLRAEPPLRLHQVRDRRAFRGHQGGCLQDSPDHRRPLPQPLRERRRSSISSTTPPSLARCATSPPARKSRSWS